MKTKEFIEKAEELGFVVREGSDLIIVSATFMDTPIITVRSNELYQIDSRRDHSAIDKKALKGLFDYTVQYASTPLEEREEEKKYHIELINDVVKCNSRGSYLNLVVDTGQYMMSASKETSELKTQFTQKEIDNFPDDVKEVLPLCQQIEVTP